jgi:hypothetical protein
MKKPVPSTPVIEDPDKLDGLKAVGCLFLGLAILTLILCLGNLLITNLR